MRILSKIKSNQKNNDNLYDSSIDNNSKKGGSLFFNADQMILNN
jgi:hypothetical protein